MLPASSTPSPKPASSSAPRTTSNTSKQHTPGVSLFSREKSEKHCQLPIPLTPCQPKALPGGPAKCTAAADSGTAPANCRWPVPSLTLTCDSPAAIPGHCQHSQPVNVRCHALPACATTEQQARIFPAASARLPKPYASQEHCQYAHQPLRQPTALPMLPHTLTLAQSTASTPS